MKLTPQSLSKNCHNTEGFPSICWEFGIMQKYARPELGNKIFQNEGIQIVTI